jgi:hypothetical protein
MVIFKTCLNFSAYKGSGVGVEGGDGVSGMRQGCQGCVRDASGMPFSKTKELRLMDGIY